MKRPTLKVTGAAEHNLKNISVSIPHNALTVITGVSGSGKSSLAYSVIFKESQRRFLESFSSWSRQYLGKLEKPNVKSITGLQPALAIHQRNGVANPRSTVGTMSGIYDYLRLLFARTGESICSNCGEIRDNKKEGPCGSCGVIQPEILAKLFSFNSTYGACPTCKGLGITEQIDPEKLIANENKTLAEGALVPTTPTGYIVYSQVRVDELDKVCRAHGFSVNIPWNKLSNEQRNVIWYGSDRIKILFGKHSLESRLKWKGITAKPREEAWYKGMLPIMEEILLRDRNDNILRFASSFQCPDCNGSRLRKEALSVLIQNKNIAELNELSLSALYDFIKRLSGSIVNNEVSEHILEHVFKRLEYLQLLGLGYLCLSRESTTLSGGESQRIRLASQVGTGLQGILYILDEPSIGLHPRDNQKLLNVLKSLRDNGNTLLVVEHDEETIRAADYLIDIGPKAGINGGELIFEGLAPELLSNPGKYPLSLTAKSFSAKQIYTKEKAKRPEVFLQVFGANRNNLKEIDVKFMLNAFNVVTGVSGAGKSTLVHQVLAEGLKNKGQQSGCRAIKSSFPITRIIEIDQSPIGRTPRSNPATYTDLFDHIRDIFAKLPESLSQGYKKGRFSFNNNGGRCEACQGAGSIHLGMHFLGDVETVCETCQGQRFNTETLKVRYKGKNIYDVLELSIGEASHFFKDEQKISRILFQLMQLEVGYLKLGQPSTTLSGGEAQRVKLASELYKTSRGHTLYILDEPTAGLHKTDIQYLLKSLRSIVNNNNTVIVIEHDKDVIEQADHIVDLGPEGGTQGGQVIVQGSLKDLLRTPQSFTAAALNQLQNDLSIPEKNFSKTKTSPLCFNGITTHNLKHLDVCIPHNKITVISGVSGSGKSSLAFDTIFAESRNRFTESLSTYARRMMSKVKKAELEHCSGLTPAIAIRQDRFQKNPRSTVGTSSEIYDLYRLLYSRAGKDKKGNITDLPASQFSFNNAEAACAHCKGLGLIITTTEEKIITHPEKSIVNGAMDGSLPGKYFGDPFGQFVNTLLKVGEQNGIDFTLPYLHLSEKARKIALLGTGEVQYEVEWKFKRGNRSGIHNLLTVWKGFTNYINEEYTIKKDGKRGEAYAFLMTEQPCPKCNGKRLKPKALEVLWQGQNITSLSNKTIHSAIQFFQETLNNASTITLETSGNILHQILDKLNTLKQIGLGYIAVNRATASLSGGESQRLRIATQLVSDLCGLTYVLDEPSIGLHSHDTRHLMDALRKLKDNRNTIVIVEHDPDIIRQADHIIELGPGAGTYGGKIIAKGSLLEILKNKKSITAKYLSNSNLQIPVKHRDLEGTIFIKGAVANNLQNIDVSIPGGGITAITGKSGSGKTSLAFEVIAASFNAGKPIHCSEARFNEVNGLLLVDQQKIGTSPLSTAATYTGLFDLVRELFANTDAAKSRGLKKTHFSFNSKEGRCESCKGMGKVKISLDFLSDVWVNCDSCHGNRYKSKVLKVKHNGHSISDVLNLEVEMAVDVFQLFPRIVDILNTLKQIGLGYISLGQATSTFSGGETQRLKLAVHLLQKNKSKTLFIFDEPSTGLHAQDVERLISVFQKLADAGHTIIVVEHNLDIIRASDWIMDLGPEGGNKGGQLLYAGVPSKVGKVSFTGMALNGEFH